MEPDLGGQEKPLRRRRRPRRRPVAMEPDLGGQEKGQPRSQDACRHTRRNGA